MALLLVGHSKFLFFLLSCFLLCCSRSSCWWRGWIKCSSFLLTRTVTLCQIIDFHDFSFFVADQFATFAWGVWHCCVGTSVAVDEKPDAFPSLLSTHQWAHHDVDNMIDHYRWLQCQQFWRWWQLGDEWWCSCLSSSVWCVWERNSSITYSSQFCGIYDVHEIPSKFRRNLLITAIA